MNSVRLEGRPEFGNANSELVRTRDRWIWRPEDRTRHENGSLNRKREL